MIQAEVMTAERSDPKYELIVHGHKRCVGWQSSREEILSRMEEKQLETSEMELHLRAPI